MADIVQTVGAVKTNLSENEKQLSLSLAKAHKLSMMSKPEFEKMVVSLKPLGATFELTPIRTNLYKNGREPFAYKVKMNGCSFIVDNQK